MIVQNKRLVTIFTIVAFILIIPFVAMQFTNEVKWSLFDFIIAAVLLSGTGLLCELVMRKVTKTSHRLLLCGLILAVLLLIWAELAVGIFGTAFAGS